MRTTSRPKERPFHEVPIGHIFEGWGDYFGITEGPMWIRAWKDKEYGGTEIKSADQDDLGVGFCVGKYEPVHYEGEVYSGKYSRSEPSVGS